MVATIYSADGEIVTTGMQTGDVCNEAAELAAELAAERGESVYLVDHDGPWEASTDGSFTRLPADHWSADEEV